MSIEDTELRRRLFVRATEVLEDTLEPALAGQAATLPPEAAARRARHLARTARESAAIAILLESLSASSESTGSPPVSPPAQSEP